MQQQMHQTWVREAGREFKRGESREFLEYSQYGHLADSASQRANGNAPRNSQKKKLISKEELDLWIRAI
jgi:hypothetical protein